MIIKTLRLRNFRNYQKTEISFHPKINVITGHNAQGKTNLLESLVYLSLTRSYRVNDDKDLIRRSQSNAQISCIYEDEREKRIDAIIHERGKTLMINKNIVKRSSEFIGLLNVVLFSPDDLGIFNDSPRIRRRLMNQEITKVSSSYLNALGKYQNLLKNRNSLLKQAKVDESYLDILDKQMIQEELIIIQERMKFIQFMNQKMIPIYQYLSNDTIKVDMKYLCCIDTNDLENNLQKMYQNNRKRDLENHMTTMGIHREDIQFQMNGENIIVCASQGQKRMTILAFKIALLSYIEYMTKKKPILLLDDVLSELDQIRQRRLIDMINGPYQCLITTTEIPDFLKEKIDCIYSVNQGAVTKER